MTSPIAERMRAIVEHHGPWTAHNIQLDEHTWTIGPEPTYDSLKLRRVMQIVSDNMRRPWPELRALDLACLEGQYALELARRGAQVVALEGREMNIEKARFAREALGADRADFRQEDVRGLSAARHGRFDVVLCLGILYHLDAPDVFEFVRRIGEVCDGFAVFDTHVSMTPRERREFGGRTYCGESWTEHRADANEAERLRKPWLSLDNPTSFKPTRASLFNLLSHHGFTSVYECQMPAEPAKPSDRLTLLALRGTPVELNVMPRVNAMPLEEWPERPTRGGLRPPHMGPGPSLIRRLTGALTGRDR
ncbi:MAG TPA: methyltransferase domain-containing protein [Gemmatimonadales bacterium]|nr:methyltransferase domain-containing protein [Gemmatimonadales bacterium]